MDVKTEENESNDGPLGIEGIFLLHFNMKKGNIVEFSHLKNKEINLNGIEWKGMPNGSHKIQSDFCVFKHDGYFAISAFNNFRTDNKEERNARLRSLGILSRDYDVLFKVLGYLTKTVESINQKSPVAKFDELITYVNEFNKNYLKKKQGKHEDKRISRIENFGFGSVLDLFQYFGQKTMIIWKSCLLKKKTLFYKSPPVSKTCSFCSACDNIIQISTKEKKTLDSQSAKAQEEKEREEDEEEQKVTEKSKLLDYNYDEEIDWKLNLKKYSKNLFLVGLTQNWSKIIVEKDDSFLSCTTDKVLLERKDLFDLIFDENEIIQSDQSIVLTENDVYHYGKLKEIMNNESLGNLEKEKQLISYFENLNFQFLSIIKQYAIIKNQKELKRKDLKEYTSFENCKYPSFNDLRFIEELAIKLGIKINTEKPRIIRKAWYLLCPCIPCKIL